MSGKSKAQKRAAYSESAQFSEVLQDILKDNLSPEATAVIASYIDTANSTVGTNNPAVDDQVAWFAQGLRELVGGDKEYNRLCEEVGL